MQHRTRQPPPKTMVPIDPIREPEYERIILTAKAPRPRETPRNAALRGAEDIAIIGLMRDGLLRPRHAVAIHWYHLQRGDDGIGRLTIPPTVSYFHESTVTAYISERTMDALDEMYYQKQLMGIDNSDYRIIQLNRQQLRRRIRNACAFAGLEGRYSASSPINGMVHDLVRGGATILQVMAGGRWKSLNTVARLMSNMDPMDSAVAEWYRTFRRG